MSIHCIECGGTSSGRWWRVGDGQWLCETDAQHIRDTFALAAMLQCDTLDLLLAVCDT